MEQSFQQLSSAKNTPSRQELLSIVRKHSESLGQSGEDDRAAGSGGELDMRFWKELLNMFFICGGDAAKSSHDDDLVFFVRLMSFHYSDGGFGEEGQPYFVRRWLPELDKVIGENSWEVDWCRSFYLNLIAHTSYSLTVAICSEESLHNYQKSTGTPLTPIYKVTKRVYASPSRVDFQKNHSKGSETVAAYPNIYFDVDNYDDTFDSVILKEEGDCFCVLLHAYGGAAIPGGENQGNGDEVTQNGFANGPILGDTQGANSSRVTLFSGFVNYDLVCSAFEAGKGNLGGLLHLGDNGGRSERLVMRGPKGRGQVDVIVSCLASRVHEKIESPSSASATRGPKSGIDSILRKVVVVAKNAYAAASSTGRSSDGSLSLRCCLLSLSLPWDSLAYDLLFKGAPKEIA
ncbi:hypothetical protein O6H91_12G068800 [Diphasiastrum complanatum]|nr:hypothetical protein O6H91_12G068700 [Diphasiastrum complanatum]KAJ7536420.1 hypothetical protein O6H91_12G068800 [Diphasiastrum complanatum]